MPTIELLNKPYSRRGVMATGVKVAYITPLVLASMRAMPALADGGTIQADLSEDVKTETPLENDFQALSNQMLNGSVSSNTIQKTITDANAFIFDFNEVLNDVVALATNGAATVMPTTGASAIQIVIQQGTALFNDNLAFGTINSNGDLVLAVNNLPKLVVAAPTGFPASAAINISNGGGTVAVSTVGDVNNVTSFNTNSFMNAMVQQLTTWQTAINGGNATAISQAQAGYIKVNQAFELVEDAVENSLIQLVGLVP